MAQLNHSTRIQPRSTPVHEKLIQLLRITVRQGKNNESILTTNELLIIIHCSVQILVINVSTPLNQVETADKSQLITE